MVGSGGVPSKEVGADELEDGGSDGTAPHTRCSSWVMSPQERTVKKMQTQATTTANYTSNTLNSEPKRSLKSSRCS